jgi:hypothetical protein
MPEKRLPSKKFTLPSFEDIAQFLAEFETALFSGVLDTHLPDLIQIVDDRVVWYQSAEPKEHDPLVAAFLSRVERLRNGPETLELGECYTVLGARYKGVVVRYCGPAGDPGEIRAEVLDAPASSPLKKSVFYRIPHTAIDKRVADPE